MGANSRQRKSHKGAFALVYLLIAGLFASNVATGLALVFSPDVVRLMENQSRDDMGAYEDRIARLRLEVDRLHSRQYARSGDINLQLQDLMAQQGLLAEQQDYVKALADKARSMGIEIKVPSSTARPELTSSLFSFDDDTRGVEGLIEQLETMQSETLMAMSALARAADESTNSILSEMEQLGISTKLPGARTAQGGPFIPALDDSDMGAHVDAANQVIQSLDRFVSAKKLVASAPVHRPLSAAYAITSNFGNRHDPFNGRSAFHSGMDFGASRGTPIRAAGAGKVIFAGRKGGYGNAVEILHENGLVTRYAHMSRILVSKGEQVTFESVIGKVGSTGRSTGAHLHFEVRLNDKPVNPARFMNAGSRLSKFL